MFLAFLIIIFLFGTPGVRISKKLSMLGKRQDRATPTPATTATTREWLNDALTDNCG